MYKKITFWLLVANIPSVYASGFQIAEQSTSGLGRAYAGEAAIIDNAAAGNSNPALMTRFNRPALSIGAIYIKPNISLSGMSLTSSKDASISDIAPNQTIPNAHLVIPISDKWAFGGSITSKYGLSTKFNEYYIAGSLAGETSLTTVNFNLSSAYQFNRYFSVGAGINALYAKAKIIRQIGENNLTIPTNTTISFLKGDNWSYGWNLGLIFEPNEYHRFGITYRSKMDVKFKGIYKSDITTQGSWVNGNLTLNLPDTWEFSGYHQISQPLAFHYSFALTRWHHFQELKATKTENNSTLFYKNEQFSNAYRLAIGATYRYNEQWTFRTGLAFDHRAAKEQPSISIPDQNRYWVTAGTTYDINQHSAIDFGTAFVKGKSISFTEKSPVELGNSPYRYKTNNSQAWLFGLNYNYRF